MSVAISIMQICSMYVYPGEPYQPALTKKTKQFCSNNILYLMVTVIEYSHISKYELIS